MEPTTSFTEDERYRLLVGAVTDYAIYMLDPTGIVSTGIRVQSVLRDTFRTKLSASTSRGSIPRKIGRAGFREGHCKPPG
jgi:hypothetical protein